MTSSDKGIMNRNTNCNRFRAFDFGINVHLVLNTDEDATYSVASLYKSDHMYKTKENILTYFSFPFLLMAVELCARYVLIFNAHEPCSISSRRNNDDVVYCVSMYLKTADVGLNDNSI